MGTTLMESTAAPSLSVIFRGNDDDVNFSVHVSERKITNVDIHSLRTLGYALNDSSAGMAFSTWRRKGLKRRSESVRTEHLMTEAICSWMDVADLNRPFVTKKRAVNSWRRLAEVEAY